MTETAFPGAPTGKKRLLRSCNECRASKTRCLPGDEDDEVCQRCARLRKSCVFSEVQERSRRRNRGPSRITRLEEKISSIHSLLRSGPAASSPVVPPPAEMPRPATVDILAMEPSPLPPALFPTVPLQQRLPGSESQAFGGDGAPRSPWNLFNGLITSQLAGELLDGFKQENMPYVTIPVMPLQAFEEQHPFLLLAILTTQAKGQPELHAPLELELRTLLATKLIVEGQRTLDLLQGLVVYLNWYHFHSKHTTQIAQAFTLVNIALSMATELFGDDTRSEEKSRALLGASLFATSISLLTRKLPRTQPGLETYIACETLTKASERGTDAWLLKAVKIHQIMDNVRAALGRPARQRDCFSVEKVQLTVEAFKSQLDALKRSFTAEEVGSPSLWLLLDSVYVHLYEVSLFLDPSKHPASDLGQGAHLSAMRTELLLECLEATKRYLDRYLSTPLHMVTMHSCLEKAQLAHAIIVLIKLSLCASAGVESLHFRQACRVSYYLGAVAALNASISTSLAQGQSPDSFRLYGNFLTRTKAWYERIEAQEPGSGPPNLVNMSTMEILGNSSAEVQFDFDFTGLDLMYFAANERWNDFFAN